MFTGLAKCFIGIMYFLLHLSRSKLAPCYLEVFFCYPVGWIVSIFALHLLCPDHIELEGHIKCMQHLGNFLRIIILNGTNLQIS